MFSTRRPRSVLRPALIGVLLAAPLASQDAQAQVATVVSTASDGTVGNGRAANALAISADGRFVVFSSNADNLVAGDTNGKIDVFVKDRQTNTTTRVSVTSTGTQAEDDSDGSADISDDGRYVVFTTLAKLADNDTNHGCGSQTTANCQDVYVHDRVTALTTLVSAAMGGGAGDNRSLSPSISGDGRYVSFTSYASTLVLGDLNNASDVFVRDLLTLTTTRVSVTSTGEQGPALADSYGSDLNSDGSMVTFVSRAVLAPSPSDPHCSATDCLRAYLHQRNSGVTRRVPLPIVHEVSEDFVPFVTDVRIDSSGRWVAMGVSNQLPNTGQYWLFLYDRVADKSILVREGTGFLRFAFSGDGRVITAAAEFANLTDDTEFFRFDRTTGHLSIGARASTAVSSKGDLGLATNNSQDPDQNATVVLLDYDADNDLMDDSWETAFGLDPTIDDRGLDKDGDNVTNLAEHDAGTHPNGVVKRYLAEGAVNAFFTTRIALFNPNDQAEMVSLRFLGTSGLLSSHVEPLLAHERKTLVLTRTANIPENDFSTVIESDRLVVVDRTMTWDATTFGAHAETALEAPATTWYLAEGATHGWFSLFYLLQNPNDTPAEVTINYLRLAPSTPVVRQYTVPPNSRLTIPVDDQGPELDAVDVAARIDSNLPIIAERAMYASPPGQPVFAAGHGGAGVTSTALKWFLAEGATGSFFDLYVLVANPNPDDSELTVTYMFPSGPPLVKPYTVGANNRLTISVEQEDARLADTPVSIIVESTNNQPVVVERAMWWPGNTWYEAHLSAGTTTTGTKWALADGELDLSDAKETYILIANTGDTDGNANVTFYREGGPSSSTRWAPITINVLLPANSRTNVPASALPDPLVGVEGHRFATVVESNGVPIVVERAMYQTTNGLTWSIGTSAVATKLP